MFGKNRKQNTGFVLNTDEVSTYFKEEGFIETTYKAASPNAANDKLAKEINRILEKMEWMKGYEFVNQNYVIYHGKKEAHTKQLFEKDRKLAESSFNKTGLYNKANEDIENFVIRDSKEATCYLLRVGKDMIKVGTTLGAEEDMKRMMKEINSFVYKIEK